MFLFCLSNWRASPQWYRGCTLTMPQLSGRLPHNSGSFSPLVCRQWDLLPALACCESPLILVGWLHVRRCGLSNAFCVSAQNGVHQSKKWLQQVLYQDLWSSLFEQTSLSCRFYSSCFLAFALCISSALIIGLSNLCYTWDRESLLCVLYSPYCAWIDFCVNLLIDVSLKQRGLSPTLHLEHQITHESSLIMVPSQSLFSFLALPAMMFVSRYVEQALGNGCCVDVEQLVSILILSCRKQCGKERRTHLEARVSRY